MKIKTITCQHVYNYGATLQAYALQHYLELQGHDVEIIDFNPHYLLGRYNPFWLSHDYKGMGYRLLKKFPSLRFIIMPIRALKNQMFKFWGRKKAFDKFEAQFYHLTPVKYLSSADLRRNPPIADVYVAGSDQIWNTFGDNGKDPSFYLDFGDDKVKRISYAASLATNEIADGWSGFVKEKVKCLDAVSVREKTGADILFSLGINNVTVVLDPVFLLEKDEWRKLSSQGNLYGLAPKSYILAYDFLGNDPNMISFIKRYAASHHLKIVSINDYTEHAYADMNINNAGPLEFLALIDNAACVVGSSFHATAFSVIFETEFYTFNLVGYNNSSRMSDLLSSLSLQERMNPKEIDSKKIDWHCVFTSLSSLKSKSKEFLHKYCL